MRNWCKPYQVQQAPCTWDSMIPCKGLESEKDSPYGTEEPSLSSNASFDAGSPRKASEEYSLIQEPYGPLALMVLGAAIAAALNWHPMYAYSLVHGTMAASIQGRLCGETHKLKLLDMAAETLETAHQTARLMIIKHVFGLSCRVCGALPTWCKAASSSMSIYAFVVAVGTCICPSLTPQLCSNQQQLDVSSKSAECSLCLQLGTAQLPWRNLYAG